MKLFIVNNGLYHYCSSVTFNYKYHCVYYYKTDAYYCRYCLIDFPSILAIGSIIKANDNKYYFIGRNVSYDVNPNTTPYIEI